MPTLTSQLSDLSAVGIRIPAFPATALPAGLARYAGIVALQQTGSPQDEGYQAKLERWCEELEALYAHHIAGTKKP